MSAQEEVVKELRPTLEAGLVALCRARPEDPVTWLAEYLLENKPAPSLKTEEQIEAEEVESDVADIAAVKALVGNE